MMAGTADASIASALVTDAVVAGRSERQPSVVFLSPTAQIGGAERVLLDMIASLRAAHPDQRLAVITSGDGPLVERAIALGAIVTVLPFPPSLARLGDAGAGSMWGQSGHQVRLLGRSAMAVPGVLQYASALRRVLEALQPDVVHSNGAKMHVLAAGASKGIAPLVWHIHDYVGQRPFMRRALRLSVRQCATIIANSHSVAEDARACLGAGVPVHTMLNAVDLERFTPSGPGLDMDALAGMPPPPVGTICVGLVATFARWKGHDVFFRALAALPVELPIRAYVIGGPLYETRGSQHTMEELRHMSVERGLEGRVAFTGHVTDVASAMRSLDVVVHASVAPEPFGLAIAEAMACGRAVIASGAGGAMEFAVKEQNALVIPPGDAAALAQAIVRLVRDKSLRSRLGDEGYRTARLRFDRRRFAAGLSAIYAQVVRAANG